MQFKVLEGRHFDENGQQYNKGDVVESDRPLDRLFVNKFESLSGPSTTVGEPKIVVDGGRSGESHSPVDESASTPVLGGHDADYDVDQVAGETDELEPPPTATERAPRRKTTVGSWGGSKKKT